MGKIVDRVDWRSAWAGAFRANNPQYDRQAEEGLREYGTRMVQAMRGVLTGMSQALASPAQPGPADEGARAVSIERAQKALGDEAMHHDLEW